MKIRQCLYANEKKIRIKMIFLIKICEFLKKYHFSAKNWFHQGKLNFSRLFSIEPYVTPKKKVVARDLSYVLELL